MIIGSTIALHLNQMPEGLPVFAFIISSSISFNNFFLNPFGAASNKLQSSVSLCPVTILKKREDEYNQWLGKKQTALKNHIEFELLMQKKEQDMRDKATAEIKSNLEGTLTIMSGNSKKAFKMLQAHKIAEAIVNTYSAVMRAFSTYDPPHME